MANNIDPEKEIEKMLQEKAEATAEQEERERQEQQEREEFLKQFDEAMEAVILPAVGSVSRAAEKAGVTSSVENLPALERMLNPEGIVLKLMRQDSDGPVGRPSRPRTAGLWIMANPRSKLIDIYKNGQSDTSKTQYPAEHVPIEKLTGDKVKEAALILVKELFQNP